MAGVEASAPLRLAKFKPGVIASMERKRQSRGAFARSCGFGVLAYVHRLTSVGSLELQNTNSDRTPGKHATRY